MNPPISVIVPTKNSEATIDACLKSIKNQTYSNIEIIVVDNNSSDKTKEKARKFTNNVFEKGPERSAQRNFGAQKSKGSYLLFIDSDMELEKKVVEECITKIKDYKGLIIPEKSFGTSFWAKCKALERSFYVGVDWIEAARFFPKEIFTKFNGYDEKQTGTEDFDLPQRIKNKYEDKVIGRVDEYIMHNERNLSLIYTLRKKHYYAKTAQIYTTVEANSDFFKKQANPLNRYKLFFSDPKKLFKSPIYGIGMLFMKTAEFIAGGLGYLTRQ